MHINLRQLRYIYNAIFTLYNGSIMNEMPGATSVFCKIRTQLICKVMGGARIGAGGHDPPIFRGKGDRGHNLGIIHISHIALITPLH